jgi:hypothetical protein
MIAVNYDNGIPVSLDSDVLWHVEYQNAGFDYVDLSYAAGTYDIVILGGAPRIQTIVNDQSTTDILFGYQNDYGLIAFTAQVNDAFPAGGVVATPEPATWLMLAIGLALMPFCRRAFAFRVSRQSAGAPSWKR